MCLEANLIILEAIVQVLTDAKPKLTKSMTANGLVISFAYNYV